MDLVPQDVARWRREMINWTRTSGPEWYKFMIDIGQQNVRPVGPSGPAGAWLAQQEVKRLSEATLSFFDQDTCDIVSGAFGSMPAFAPVATDLPSPSGFVMFAKPIMGREVTETAAARNLIDMIDKSVRPENSGLIDEFSRRMDANGNDPDQVVLDMARDLAPDDDQLAETIRNEIAAAVNLPARRRNEMLLGSSVRIVGASWSAADMGADPRYRAGGVWISFYSSSNLDGVVDDLDLLARCRNIMPQIAVDNETIVPWCPSPDDRDDYLLDDTKTTSQWVKMLLAAFRIGQQRALCTEVVERCQRAERRRNERDGIPARDINVVRLRPRRSASTAAPGTGTKHSYRYPVSPHWRQQWYPSIRDHRPILIAQHIRGPEGAELRHADRVTVL